MNIYRVKLLAAAVILACGLGTGVGTVMVANAQQPVKADPALIKGRADHVALSGVFDVKLPKWEYRFDRKPLPYTPTIERFKQTLQTAENDGWEFVGQVNTTGETPDQPVLPTLVFRKMATHGQEILAHHFDKATCTSCHAVSPNGLTTTVERLDLNLAKTNPAPQDFRASFTSALEKLDQKNANISDLEAQIAALKSGKEVDRVNVLIPLKDLPLGVAELKDILNRVALKIGVKDLQVGTNPTYSGYLNLVGPKDSVEWAKRLIESLSGKAMPPKPSSPVKP